MLSNAHRCELVLYSHREIVEFLKRLDTYIPGPGKCVFSDAVSILFFFEYLLARVSAPWAAHAQLTLDEFVVLTNYHLSTPAVREHVYALTAVSVECRF